MVYHRQRVRLEVPDYFYYYSFLAIPFSLCVIVIGMAISTFLLLRGFPYYSSSLRYTVLFRGGHVGLIMKYDFWQACAIGRDAGIYAFVIAIVLLIVMYNGFSRGLTNFTTVRSYERLVRTAVIVAGVLSLMGLSLGLSLSTKIDRLVASGVVDLRTGATSRLP